LNRNAFNPGAAYVYRSVIWNDDDDDDDDCDDHEDDDCWFPFS
jgi:hypothetical protein